MTTSQPGADNAAIDACLAQLGRGELQAMADLYELTHSAVYGFALSILKHTEDAQDVAQDVYLHLYRSAGSYRSHGKPRAWLLTVTRHLALDRLRTRGKVISLEERQEGQLLPSEEMENEDRLVLRSLLEVLGQEERQVITLHALAGLKHREIARILDLPLATVLSKYSRGMKKLQLAWKES